MPGAIAQQPCRALRLLRASAFAFPMGFTLRFDQLAPEGLQKQGFIQTLLGYFPRFFVAPWGREWPQNVAPGANFRTPMYRPNPANGGPIGGKNTF